MYGSEKRLTIAIDYDDTITTSISMWVDIIRRMKSGGADVYIVTSRSHAGSDIAELSGEVDGIIATGNKAKWSVVDADIWIDDNPMIVTHHFDGMYYEPAQSTEILLKSATCETCRWYDGSHSCKNENSIAYGTENRVYPDDGCINEWTAK